jgi:DNA mismatch endonuclease (patch repair protein)
MVDRLAPDARSRLMARIGPRNTAPELAVRRAAHAAGFRFRLHRRDLPGTPDLVFPRFRAAVFVHGCFWHGHGCAKGRLPKSREDYWHPKIAANRARDVAKAAALEAAGWRVLTIWQCEIGDPAALAMRIGAFLAREDSDRHSPNDPIR